MAVASMRQLLESGVHFGHQTRRWNPKMREFIFTERNGIHILDLQQTVHRLQTAYEYTRQLAENGKTVLFVGTKKQAQEAVAARRGLELLVLVAGELGFEAFFALVKRRHARPLVQDVQ